MFMPGMFEPPIAITCNVRQIPVNGEGKDRAMPLLGAPLSVREDREPVDLGEIAPTQPG
jgi:hypothetical protein